ncbi:RNA 3'-phosphate cyclase, partial [bacterium]|nr:RNA 3'-phosphate cyclase [bacterium]
MHDTVHIDGSQGEGGGQIIRTSLALSMITGRPVEFRSIRAGRPKPGLRAQHLTCVKAACRVCSGEVEGAKLGSTSLRFVPGEVRAGTVHFEVGTAGSASLVLQTVFLPLALAGARSIVTIGGGTHVSWSPTHHFLEWHWASLLRRLGLDIELTLTRAGYYPKGGGEIRARILPVRRIAPLELGPQGRLEQLDGLSMLSNLPRSIAERQRRQALRRLDDAGLACGIEVKEFPARGMGTMLLLRTRHEGGARACFTALGAKGKRAETVADEAVDDLLAFLDTTGAVDGHTADQLLLPLAFADGPSEYTVS